LAQVLEQSLDCQKKYSPPSTQQNLAAMRWSTLALVLAFAVCGDASVLRGKSESLSLQLEESDEWSILSEASAHEAEDRSFLLSQLDQTELQLKNLQELVAAPATPTEKKAAPVAPAAPVAKKEAAPAAKKESAPVAKKEAAPAAKKEAAPVAPAAPVAKKEASPAAPAAKKEVAKTAAVAVKEEADPMKMLASIKMPNLSGAKGLAGAMALAPMLAMLKGMYEDTKERISQQNVREEKSKKWFTEKEADHKAKLAKIEGKFANHTLSEEFRTNETRDETRYFNYWQRCRERQHRQFHTNLKIQHAMMSKSKKMIDMYEKALSPKAEDQKKAKKELGAMTGMPEIVFLQTSVLEFCKQGREEVAKERDELNHDLESDELKQMDRNGVTW